MNYYNYIHRTFKVPYFYEFIKNTNSIVPYCIPHVQYLIKHNTISNIKIDKGFDKWYNRPGKSHKLYWTLHPNEYPYK